jgi:hypothetical protein
MFHTKHIVEGVTVGLALTLLGVVLIPERYEIKAQTREPGAAAVSAPSDGEVRAEEVPTVFGSLLLGYSGGEVLLSGALRSSEACGAWDVDMVRSDGRPSMIEFRLAPRDPDPLCIEALGEKTDIFGRAPAGSDTLYLIRLGDDIIFSGELAPLSDMSLETI